MLSKNNYNNIKYNIKNNHDRDSNLDASRGHGLMSYTLTIAPTSPLYEGEKLLIINQITKGNLNS